MDKLDHRLMVEQLDRKLAKMQILKDIEVPSKGWLNAIRTTVNMSLVQLAKRLNKTSVSVKEIEEREQNKTITLKKLIEVCEALDLEFVYGFLPKESSIEAMIDKRARQVAREIVMRTSQTMKLEEQENSEERLQQATNNRAEILKQEMPRHLWD
jgi:predicted DNA-binding mobile mystery protein A